MKASSFPAWKRYTSNTHRNCLTNGRHSLQSITIKHLTLFTEYSFDERYIENWSFSQLESLNVEYKITFHNAWMEFFRQNHNIRRLHLTNPSSIVDLDLAQITSDLMDLIEMSVESEYLISCEHISQFIRSHSNVIRFQFVIRAYPDQMLNELCAQFQNEWHIQHIEGQQGCRGLSFEKKN